MEQIEKLCLPDIFKNNRYFPLGSPKFQATYEQKLNEIANSKFLDSPVNSAAVRNKFLQKHREIKLFNKF